MTLVARGGKPTLARSSRYGFRSSASPQVGRGGSRRPGVDHAASQVCISLADCPLQIGSLIVENTRFGAERTIFKQG